MDVGQSHYGLRIGRAKNCMLEGFANEYDWSIAGGRNLYYLVLSNSWD